MCFPAQVYPGYPGYPPAYPPAYPPVYPPAYPPTSVFDALLADPARFTLLARVIGATGNRRVDVLKLLSDPTQELTLLAPTDTVSAA